MTIHGNDSITARTVEDFASQWRLYFPEREVPALLVLDDQGYDDLDNGEEFVDVRALAQRFLQAPFYLRTIARDDNGFPCEAWVLVERTVTPEVSR